MNKKRKFTKKDLVSENKLDLEVEMKENKKVVKEQGEKIKKELLEIYENDDGSLPDMQNFSTRKSSSLGTAFLILFLACLFLGVVTWLGFFIFQPNSKFNESDVILTVSGEQKVMAGQEVTYRIHYRNDQNVPLSKANLQVRYPEGFLFEKSSQPATNDKNDEWILGAIQPHNSGFVDVSGKMFGNLSEKKSFRVFLNYNPANFNSEFQKVSSQVVEISQSPVELKVETPLEAYNGDRVVFKIDLQKKVDNELNNLALVIEPGPSFNKVSSTPISDSNNLYRWSIPVLNNDLSWQIAGSLNGDDTSSSVKFTVKIISWPDNKRNGEGYVVAEFIPEIKLIKSALRVDMAVNGTTRDSIIEPGEVMNVSINVKNDGEKEIENALVKLYIDAPSYNNKSILDWSKLNDSNDGEVSGQQQNSSVRRGMIVWNTTKIPVLKQINSGDTALIDINLPLKNGSMVDLSQFESSLITTWAEIKFDQGGETKTLVSSPINLLVNSDLNFSVKDQLSTNSIGQETHKITWLLSNSFHELKNIVVEAELYGDFIWNNENLVVPAGKAVFDEKEKKLTWRVDSMPTSLDVLGLQFLLTLNKKNPTQTSLTSKVRLKAIDTVTGQEIVKVGNEVLLN